MPDYLYLKNLKSRQHAANIRACVIFGQTTGWILTLVGAFHYFILWEQPGYFVLLLGNALIILGFGIPESLELPHRILRGAAEFISTQLFRIMLALVYFIVVLPIGLLKQKLNGKAPFYSWQDGLPMQQEGWIPKVCSDEARIIQSPAHFTHNNFLQLLSHFVRGGEFIILPSFLIILVLGLLTAFLQSTVVAPMIYTLF